VSEQRTLTSSPAGDAASDPAAHSGPTRPERSLGSMARRGALWAVAANVIMRFAGVAVTALLARLLSKEDFGVFAVALAVYLVVASLAELGMASAVARAPMEPEDIAPTVASISILVSGVVGLGMAVCAPVLASVLGQPDAAGPIRVLSLCLVLTGIFAVPGAQLVREFRQDRIFLATIVGFVVANPVLVVLALNGGGATAFAWSRVIGQVATGVVYVFSTSRRYRPGWRSEAVGPLIRFGLPLSLANLVNWTLLNADYMLLGRLVDAAQIGVYLIAFNVASWSTAVMGSVLNSVVVPAFGRVSDDRRRLGDALVSASELVAVVAMAFGALTLALAGPLVTVLFGAKWSEATPVLAVLSVYGVLYAFSLLFANILVATGRTARLLVVQLSWVAVLVPAMLVGLHHQGLSGVAWAHVVTIGLVSVPAYAVCVLRVTGQSAGELLRTWRLPTAAGAVAAAGAWVVSQAFATPWMSLLAGGAVGGVLYLAGVAPLAVRRLPPRLVPGRLASRWRPASVSEGV
jgi:lipopolysaccharide exporter